ncbi:MAG: HD-GYP domain-containing protein [Thermodesulfobacteriota bacterium]
MTAITRVIEATMEAKDPYTVQHQRRVTQIALSIAGKMGLSGASLEKLRIAGTLHDLGKVGVPTEILVKPGKLTELEFSIIKTHPMAGFEILKPLEFPQETTQIVLQHHERWNGSGYPQGLLGNGILLEARILGVADVVEAMATHRPYRPALGIDQAMEEISRNRGILYDPTVVQTCSELYNENKLVDDFSGLRL